MQRKFPSMFNKGKGKDKNKEEIKEKLLNISLEKINLGKSGNIPLPSEETNLLLPPEVNTSISLKPRTPTPFFGEPSKIKITSNKDTNDSIKDRLTRCHVKF